MWHVSDGQLLRHHGWSEDEFVLYNDLSGDTHLLDGAAIEILLELQRGACDAPALVHALGLRTDADSSAQLNALLAELAALALLEHRP